MDLQHIHASRFSSEVLPSVDRDVSSSPGHRGTPIGEVRRSLEVGGQRKVDTFASRIALHLGTTGT